MDNDTLFESSHGGTEGTSKKQCPPTPQRTPTWLAQSNVREVLYMLVVLVVLVVSLPVPTNTLQRQARITTVECYSEPVFFICVFDVDIQ
jgi:hypothetical protein